MNRKKWLGIYTVLHCLVDMSCIFFLTGLMIPIVADHDKWLFLAVFYNMLAFALPMLFGLLADYWKNDVLLASIGCASVAAAYLLYKTPFAAVVFLGIGNGLFHIGGGRQVLRDSKEKYAPCGIFISSGALGVYLGAFWGKNYEPIWNYFFVGLLLGCALLWVLRHQGSEEKTFSTVYVHNKKLFCGVVLALLVVVIIRSYYGTILNYSWKKGFWIGLLFTACIVVGKFLGGVLADCLGIGKAIGISLGLAGILALFSFDGVVPGCLSILFFNMTMPLTLSFLYRLMPEKPGFAFGMLMFGLFVGTLPSMAYDFYGGFSPMGLAVFCFLSMILMIWAVRAEGKCVKR